MADLIVFDIFAQYAHFKRPYTTTSPVSFPIPSKPTLYGMIAAIIGLDKESYLERFYNQGIKLGITVVNPLDKIYIAENLINTKEDFARFKTHTQIKIEFLKNVKYRIYVSIPQNELASLLLDQLKAHRSVYTFSMGLSECLGNFEFIGRFQSLSHVPDPSSTQYIEIHSVIPASELTGESTSPIRFETGREIFRVSITAEMNPKREIEKMIDIIFERSGNPIASRSKTYEEIPGLNQNIILF